jgi:hypothetical protein
MDHRHSGNGRSRHFGNGRKDKCWCHPFYFSSYHCGIRTLIVKRTSTFNIQCTVFCIPILYHWFRFEGVIYRLARAFSSLSRLVILDTEADHHIPYVPPRRPVGGRLWSATELQGIPAYVLRTSHTCLSTCVAPAVLSVSASKFMCI